MNRFAPLFAVALLLLALPAFAQSDADGDGVEDTVDLCPAEDASFFDVDGDGCLDPTHNARHVEYWDLADFPLTYVIQADGAPNVTDGSDFTAIQDGFAAWSAVPGVTLSSSYGGTTADLNADGMDGINQVTFQDADFLAVYGSSVLAVGITTSFTEPSTFQGNPVRPGQIVDADMLFNPNRIFSTDTASSGPDLRSVATHEAGHLFGLSHSGVVTSTMFPALPAGTNARSLEVEDQVLAFMAYPDPAALATANTIRGTVTDGSTAAPIGGAAVFAISAASLDTLGSQYTLADGSYRFTGLPDGDYYVSISPLSGAFTNGVVPALVNDYVDGIATNTLWNPESWDLAESATDDDLARDAVNVTGGSDVAGIDIVTNVDLTGPTLVEVAPGGSEPVRADAVFFVAFDEPIDFDSAAASVTLNKIVGGTPEAQSFALLQVTDDNVIIVDPAGLMEYSAQYELVLGTGVADRFGNGLDAAVSTTFTVEAAPPLTISTISPALVSKGTVAVIYGEGFDLSDPANNVVDFGGTPVGASTVSANALSVQVPEVPAGFLQLTVSTLTETSNTLQIAGVIPTNLLAGTEISTVPVGAGPSAVAQLPDATYSYVATDDGVLSVSSSPSNPDFGTTELIALAGGADDLAVSPDGNRVYAVGRSSRTILVINSDYGDVAAPNAVFNTVLDELTTAGEPVGIAIDPSGERAYVATAGGRAEIWDIELGSGTYHRPVGLMESPVPSLEGAIEVDRTGLRVLALTGPGDLLVWDASSPSLAPQEIAVASDPRDITVGPEGVVAYVTDADGDLSVVVLATGTVSQSIAVGGSPYGYAVEPAGTVGYVADHLNGDLPAVDLASGSPTFRTVLSDIAAGGQPVDVAVAPDGQTVLSLESATNVLRIIGIGQGPQITNLEPDWILPGDQLTISGNGFAAISPETGAVNSTRVYFGDEIVLPTRSSSTTLTVPVPATFTGGQVRVDFEGAAVVNLPSRYYSNPATVRPLPVRVPTAAVPEDASRSVFLGPGSGYAFDDVGVVAAVEASPTGKFVIAVSLADRAYLINADASSPDLGQVITTIGLQSSVKPDRLAIAPDGRHAYYSGADQQIHILDTDPQSPSYATEIGIVDYTLNTPSPAFPANLAIHPSGEFMVVVDELNDQLYLVDLQESSPTYHTTLQETGPLGYATDLDIHPNGQFAYFPASTGLIHVIDLRATAGSFFQQIQTVVPGESPRSIEIKPDGQVMYVLTREYSLTSRGSAIEAWDTTNGELPEQIGNFQLLAALNQNAPQAIYMSPQGDRLLADLPADGLTLYLDVRTSLLPGTIFEEIGQTNLNGTSDVLSASFQPDGTGFWTASRGDTGISYVDQISSNKLTPISGFSQVGVAGEPLAAPLVWEIADGAGLPDEGAIAEVRVVGGGGTLGNGRDYQWVRSDADGRFSVDWTLGPDVDTDPANPVNRITLTLNDGFTLADNIGIASVADPETLPLSQIQVLPLDASTGISLTTSVQVTFSRAVDPASVGASTLILRRQSDGSPVSTVYGFADGNTRVSMIPLTGLSADTVYEIETTAGLLDASGGALTNPATTSFTTTPPPPLTLTAVSPPAATVGTQVVISGTGFAPVAADNTVHFGAASTAASSVGSGYVTAYVPLGATTGNLTVSVGSETSNARSFTVLVPETAPLDQVVSTVETGISVQSVAVTPDGAKAYTVSTETNEVLPVELSTYTNLPAIGVGTSPKGVVIHPDGSTAYVTNYGSGTVSVIDVATDTVIATISVGANPVELVTSPVGDRLYVVNSLDQTVSVIDIDATSVTYHSVVASVGTTRTTSGAAISPDGTVLYLGTSDGFLTISLQTSSFGVVSTYTTGKSTSGAAITPDGTLLLLVTTGNEVLVVDVSVGGSFGVVATIGTTKSTSGAAITPDGSLLYLLQEDTDEILVVELNISSSVSSSVVLTPVVVTTEVIKTIEVDPDPAVIAFDPSGSGLAVVGHQNTQGQLTFLNTSSTPFGELVATVDIDPNTLNLGSRGRYVTGYLELPAGFYVENIDLSSILLNGVLAPEADQTRFVDRNQDLVQELVLKFDRQAVQEILPEGDRVEVSLSGTVSPGDRAFAGVDTIRTLRPQVVKPAANDAFYPGQQILVTWISPEGVAVSSVDVHWSADDGASWMPIAVEVEDTGSVDWTVPVEFTDRALVEVTLYDARREPIGIGLSPDHFFIMEKAVPVVMQSMDLDVRDGSGHLEWRIADAQAVDGFHVLRADREDGDYQRVSTDVVRAVSTPDGMKFVFEDPSIFANRDYYYMIEEERIGAAGYRHGPYELNWRLENALYQNVPNSFNPRTTISFSIAEDGRTRLAVYNLAGRLVDVLVDEVLRADTYDRVWDGKDRSGRSVASGVYVYRLEAPGGFVAARKMTLVR